MKRTLNLIDSLLHPMKWEITLRFNTVSNWSTKLFVISVIFPKKYLYFRPKMDNYRPKPDL